MSVWIDLTLSCDVVGCENEALVTFDEPFPNDPATDLAPYMRERGTERPKVWRVVDGHDVCYRHKSNEGLVFDV